MAKILEMPKLSPTMEDGVLSAWHKREGDPIAVDDLLAEVETDKATMEFRAFDRGTLLKILAPAGAQVKLGQAVAIVGSPGEDISALLPKTPVATPAAGPVEPPAEGPVTATPSARPAQDTTPPPAQRKPIVGHVLDRTAFSPGLSVGAPAPTGGGAGGATSGAPGTEGRVLASPYVRQVAREMGVDLRGARGMGPGGRLLPADVEAMRPSASTALVRTAPAAHLAAPLLAEPEARPLSQMRRAIARRLTESKATVPHFYLSIDVDAAELGAQREKINAELATGGAEVAGFKVSLNDLLLKACAVALTRVPECNASFTADAILVHRRVDISVAVAVADGLVTPVVRNADQKSVAAIAREVKDLAARARAKKLRPEEMMNGTFSISNLGMFGIDEFAAVINPPEGAILAVGQVRDVPVVADGAVVPGKRLALTLSCDHRVVDGAVGAAFLAELRRLVERPLRILAG